MTPTHRPRPLLRAGLATVVLLALAACADDYPNSTFNHTTEFNTAIDSLWDTLLFLGTIVFVLVEAALIYTVVRYRRREGQAEPKHVHGNTTLEILWTVIPALILVFIAVPTVRTIFRTQAKAIPEALQVEVIGHQWWWEFRYPEYTAAGANGRVDTLVTANELYLPTGRTVNFHLRTQDVIHSFWVPQLGGKRDLISNHTNYLWFTPDSTLGTQAWNGFCTEYCGASHANMRFRAFTVSPDEFERWARGQLAMPAVASAMPGGPPTATPPTTAPGAGSDSASVSTAATAGVGGDNVAPPARPTAPAGATAAPTQLATAGDAYVFPVANLPAHTVPKTPIPAGLSFPEGIVGDVTRGAQIYSRSSCIGCHAIKGHPISMSTVGPNLTHIGSRTTIAAGLYPNDERHLRLWIKNSRKMKPGVSMPTLGRGETDPITKQVAQLGALSDQEIADIVAYLLALK